MINLEADKLFTMQRFLDDCASYIYNKYPDGLHTISLVVPNRRAGLFFTAYLKNYLLHPVIGPSIKTINEWMVSASPLMPAERLHLIALLYETFREVTGTGESFDDFYFWGEVLLADFDDIDKYLVNAGDLFTNLSQVREITRQFDYLTDEQKKVIEEFWGTLGSWERYHHEKNFVMIWEKLFEVYSRFRKKLEEKGIAYSGMIIRDATGNLVSGKVRLPSEHYLFIGLNALNSCEKQVFAWLLNQGKASFLWDYDDFYVSDIKNDAGKFMRQNLLDFPPPADFKPAKNGFSDRKKIEFIAVASSIGQAQSIPAFFKQNGISTEQRFDRCAIVLADESLLFPALGAIPETAGSINVTMGYPVKNSAVVAFLMLLVSLLRDTKPGKTDNIRLYFRQVTEILNHQLLAGIEPEKKAAIIRDIKINNKTYLSPSELCFSDIHRKIFTLPQDVSEYPDYFLTVLKQLFETFTDQDGKGIVRELIYHLYSGIEKLKVLISSTIRSGFTDISPLVFFRIMQQWVYKMAVPFEGEPLSGVQVMGILETRCLDFNDVLIIGLNEDTWPRTSVAPSMIPYHLRKGFGMPGIDDQDAMYSYYFYRLLQKAENISATWNSVRDALSGGELSRFGFQLMLHSPHPVTRKNLDHPFYNFPSGIIEIPSGTQNASRLLAGNLSGKPLSPSAMITFLTCSLKFYFRYLVDLKEPDEVSEDIDRQIFGKIFHKSAELLYRPLTGERLTYERLTALINDTAFMERCIRQSFASEYFMLPAEAGDSITLEGKSLLIFSTIRIYLLNLLQTDRKSAPLVIHSLEHSCETTVEAAVNGQVRGILIGGKVDRIDEKEGILRVVDYKTGNLESSNLGFKTPAELFDRSAKEIKKEALQALLYTFILSKSEFQAKDIRPVVYSILDLNDISFDFNIRMQNKGIRIADIGQELESLIKVLAGEIYGVGTKFVQTAVRDRCRSCPYREICRR